ncbi:MULTISPECIES: hypothetical protein [unclassified Mesorhizobium]|uniref:hypothetical protein n=1 Tax=unclassified Mesorhizobium TaxID=325217 RepID=UPI001FEDAA76|nr:MULTISPECIES: hypothetical protein [unclassified Mesorhizobium]
MIDPEARAEKLSRELDSAFRNRADLYRLFLDELTGELGAERAEAIMTRTIEQRGKEVAAAAFAAFGPNDARSIGEAFLSVSPDDGRMYPTDVERGPDRIAFKVKRCSRMLGSRPASARKNSRRSAASPAPSTVACSRRPACVSTMSPGRPVTAAAAAISR